VERNATRPCVSEHGWSWLLYCHRFIHLMIENRPESVRSVGSSVSQVRCLEHYYRRGQGMRKTHKALRGWCDPLVRAAPRQRASTGARAFAT